MFLEFHDFTVPMFLIISFVTFTRVSSNSCLWRIGLCARRYGMLIYFNVISNIHARCAIARHHRERDWTQCSSAIKGNRGRQRINSRYERVAFFRYYFPAVSLWGVISRNGVWGEKNRSRDRQRSIASGAYLAIFSRGSSETSRRMIFLIA